MHRLSICLTFVLVLLLAAFQARATHIRAGDLVIERVAGTSALTYRIIVTLYRDTQGVPAGVGTVNFGDGTSEVQVGPRSLGIIDNGATEVVEYTVTHTFPSAGTYSISYFERNRNPGIVNMAASNQTPFCVVSTFFISPFLGLNNSPKMLLPPIDRACVGQRFIHNPGAYDLEGDSLSYRLVTPLQSRTIPVASYSALGVFAPVQENGTAPGFLSLNPRTGDLIWDAPSAPGEYNVAFIVEEWRDGLRIGQVNRDMQITVQDCSNRRPRLQVPRDTCVVAGTDLRAIILATDPDGHSVNITATGGIFSLGLPSNRAVFSQVSTLPANGNFRWQTTCNDVAAQPYQVVFRGADNPIPPSQRLVDIRPWQIRVVGPAPLGLTATPDQQNASIQLNWTPYTCANAERMTVWRREGSFPYNPRCETGLPAAAGYVRVGTVPIGTTTFTDRNLTRGKTYCYRIYAEFPAPKGGESLASAEACAFIVTNAPYLTEVNVRSTATNTGSIQVCWTRPIDLNRTQFPGPITYRLARATGQTGSTAYTLLPQTFGENDTCFLDQNLNTSAQSYNYRVILSVGGNVIDSSRQASSVRLSLIPRATSMLLTWTAEVPWSNRTAPYRRHYIYQQGPGGVLNLIDSVDVLNNTTFSYVRTGLVQRTQYCFAVSTVGSYGNGRIRAPLINFSQIACATTVDTTVPCPPGRITLTGLNCSGPSFSCDPIADCGQGLNCGLPNPVYQVTLNWRDTISPQCDRDIFRYRIFYSPREGGPFVQIDSVPANVFTYTYNSTRSVAGCFYVAAVDTSGNQSRFSGAFCTDNCPCYILPNAFTPNGDGQNDLFTPCRCPRFVDRVDFKVYNRWGELLFTGDGNPLLNWNGKASSGAEVPTGVYYYEAKVKFYRLSAADEEVTYKGWINLSR